MKLEDLILLYTETLKGNAYIKRMATNRIVYCNGATGTAQEILYKHNYNLHLCLYQYWLILTNTKDHHSYKIIQLALTETCVHWDLPMQWLFIKPRSNIRQSSHRYWKQWRTARLTFVALSRLKEFEHAIYNQLRLSLCSISGNKQLMVRIKEEQTLQELLDRTKSTFNLWT
jgi:hypothetical protein